MPIIPDLYAAFEAAMRTGSQAEAAAALAALYAAAGDPAGVAWALQAA